MSEQNQAIGGYGYQDDEVAQGSGVKFGLNQKAIRLAKFEWIPNGGKNGEEKEALDIQFQVLGSDRLISYRKFPVTKAFDKANGNVEVTDPNHPAIKEAQGELSAAIVHILGCFVSKDAIKAALSRPINSFKEYVQICAGLLPTDFSQRPLDAFFQYQWAISGEKDRTYLELPKNMKQGKWLAPGTDVEWNEVRTNKILKYVDPANAENVHPFQRGDFFLDSNWAKQQRTGGDAPAATSAPASGGNGASAW